MGRATLKHVHMGDSGIDDEDDVRAALDWLGEVSDDADVLRERITRARNLYLTENATEANLSRDFSLEELGADKVGAYLAQADALLHDRRAYDLSLGSKIVPFIKLLGSGIELLRTIPGAAERGNRLLRSKTRDPESAVFELVTAIRYREEGFSVEFIAEDPGGRKTPDFQVDFEGILADVECKRLQKGNYEQREAAYQRSLVRHWSQAVDDLQLSVHVDVTYTEELSNVPDDYLLDRVLRAYRSPIATLSGYPWKDEYGEGWVKPANLDAVRRETRDSFLLFGTKMARLLTGAHVFPGSYNMVGGVKGNPQDPRYVDHLEYGSVVTWQCIAPQSIESRARYIKTKLNEVDLQFHASPLGIFHIAMDAERDNIAADLRRKRNHDVLTNFRFQNPVIGGVLHYFVPRVTETTSWMIDESVDRYGPLAEHLPDRIFREAEILDNDLPAWHQLPPKTDSHL